MVYGFIKSFRISINSKYISARIQNEIIEITNKRMLRKKKFI